MKTMKSWRLPAAGVIAFALVLGACRDPLPSRELSDQPSRGVGARPTLIEQSSGTEQRLQAISVVDERVVWVSGLGGTFARTSDGGETWQSGIVEGAEELQFRDVHAVDASIAYLLSAGPGEQSRIYKTLDAGTSWTLQFVNQNPEAFFDCIDFWDAESGLAFSDSVEGRFTVIETRDGGERWLPIEASLLPPAQPGEGGFAASGTCLVTANQRGAWIGTGNAQVARVLRTLDRGASWSASSTPLVSGTSAGITSLAFWDERRGVAVGGDINVTDRHSDNVAITNDGGDSWEHGGRPHLEGPIYGVAVVPSVDTPTAVIVGPSGADYSIDGAQSWTPLDGLSYWSVAFSREGPGWMVGPEGRIMKVSFDGRF